jgi:hypothetical protein
MEAPETRNPCWKEMILDGNSAGEEAWCDAVRKGWREGCPSLGYAVETLSGTVN